MSLSALNNQKTRKPVPLLTTKNKKIVMDFNVRGRYYALMAENGRFVCRCNDPALLESIEIPHDAALVLAKIVVAKEFGKNDALVIVKTILHKEAAKHNTVSQKKAEMINRICTGTTQDEYWKFVNLLQSEPYKSA